MLYQTIASVVLLATAANAASAEVKRQPYRLAVMAMPGQSLMRRDTSGYQPDQTKCKDGNNCAEACGASFQQCSGGKPGVAHCFNPAAGQSCCTDNSGNSCEAGFYCTHDSKQQTWCCPHDMDLASCAAAYTVTGLVAATAKPAPTSTSLTSTSTSTSSTSTSITSTSTSTSSFSTTISTNSSTTSRAPTTTSAPCTTSSANITTVAIVKNTTICTASAGKTTAWTALNSTIASLAPTQPSESVPSVTVVPSPASSNINAAAASGVSALLLLAAGFIALL
ncbi:hypothetical protein C2857_007258 [Epichloe festucae Fl1]|uniref:Prp 4 CRoW domain-containing protein n=1 Tax=Epichloe festucae (strain Fl1) TaxID=877507 RepID=A0A7S9KM80_EPIFF|nr:hypothetical protein C2857_007258 [Epichloe festucae Fl1]